MAGCRPGQLFVFHGSSPQWAQLQWGLWKPIVLPFLGSANVVVMFHTPCLGRLHCI